MVKKKTIRDRIEVDGEVDFDALLNAWINCELTPEDELKTILERVYYSHEDPEYREACEFIKNAAKHVKDFQR